MDERGQSLVEFAISFVILMFLLTGMVEFGVIFFQYVQLRDTAQEGALYGSICNCGPADIEIRARASSDSPIDLNSSLVSVQTIITDKFGNPKLTACEGDALAVRVSYTHKIFMPIVPKLIGRSEITLSATVTDTVLTPLCP